MKARATRRGAVAVAVVLSLTLVPGLPSAAAGPSPLFAEGQEVPAPQGALRAQTASLTDALVGASPVRVDLDFFDDASAVVVLHRRTEPTAVIWTAGNPESSGRSVEIVLSGGYLSGSAHLPGVGSFAMFGPIDGRVLITEADPGYKATEPPIEAAADASGPATDADDPPPALPDGEAPVIDVMFLLTDDVITDTTYFRENPGNAGSPVLTDQELRAAMRAWAEARVATINSGFTNSAVDASVRLVYAGKVNYAESGSTGIDLDIVTFAEGEDCEPGISSPGIQECDPEGLLDEVRDLRDDFGADVVFLVTQDGDTGGIAWLLCRPDMAEPVPNTNETCPPSHGYGIIDFGAGTQGLTVGHELGHLLGGRHDRYNDGMTTYARGHLVIGEFGTLLAYPCDPSDCAGTFTERVNHYSNPAVQYSGTPTGIDIGETHQADMASHMALSASIIAAFRDPALCRGLPVTIFGTPHADTIVGTPDADVILSFGGPDLIHAGSGNDWVCAGSGHDIVYAQGGKDRVWGQGGDDLLVGNAKRDRLFGQKGDDTLEGGSGNDRLVGGKHIDGLDGGGGPKDVCKSGETHTACETIA